MYVIINLNSDEVIECYNVSWVELDEYLKKETLVYVGCHYDYYYDYVYAVFVDNNNKYYAIKID